MERTYETVEVTREDQIAWVRFNRPEKRNAFSPQLNRDMVEVLWDLHGDDHSVVAPALVDRANLTRYDILTTNGSYDGPTMWNSKQAAVELASGDTQAYWANFAAPIDDISAIDVVMGAGPSFEDVQIEAEEG